MYGIAKHRLAFAAALLGAAAVASVSAHAARGGSSSRGSHSHSHSSAHSHHHHGPSYRGAPAVAYYAPRVIVAPRPVYVAPAYVAPAYVAPAYVPAPVYVPPPAYVAPTPYGAPVPPPAASTWRTLAGPFLAVDGASFVAGGVTYVLSGIHTFDPSTPQGAAARARLQQLLSSGAVQVWRIAVDGYGRSIARVVVNGADLSVKLRQEGYGRA